MGDHILFPALGSLKFIQASICWNSYFHIIESSEVEISHDKQEIKQFEERGEEAEFENMINSLTKSQNNLFDSFTNKKETANDELSKHV